VIPASTDPKLLDEQLEVCFAAKVPAMCFFWSVMPGVVARAHEADCLVLYQVGSVADAVEAERAGADIIIVQGVEAGGHVHGKLPLSVLLPEVAATVKLPLAASGGIVTGADMIAAMALGADGVHCGTVFLPTPESFAHEFHKRRILEAKSGDTVHTDLFAINWPPNSPVRVLRNSLTEAAGDKLWGHHPDQLPREPIGEDAGQPILKFSTHSALRSTTGDIEKMPAFAGEGVGRITKMKPAAQVIGDMMDEAETTLDRLEAMHA
jgi:nitronate monooxygenase